MPIKKELSSELARGTAKNLSGTSTIPATPEGVDDYLRPGSVDRYRRPGGVDLYKRPLGT